MAGKFEIYRDQRGEFRFRLTGKKDQVLIQSEGFATKGDAKRGAKAVQKAAVDAKVKDLTTS